MHCAFQAHWDAAGAYKLLRSFLVHLEKVVPAATYLWAPHSTVRASIPDLRQALQDDMEVLRQWREAEGKGQMPEEIERDGEKGVGMIYRGSLVNHFTDMDDLYTPKTSGGEA